MKSARFLYFSLVTLTSVGYGGIIPTNPYVRMVAAFEGVAGVFYIAVVVARLVSSYRPAERLRRSNETIRQMRGKIPQTYSLTKTTHLEDR